MKLHPVTWVLVLVAAILGGVVYFTEVRGSSQTEETTDSQQQLFGFEESQVQSFTLKTQLRSLTFERNDEGKWQMQEPDSTPADEASVAYLLNLMATGISDRVLTATTADLKEFGFDQPLATVEVKLDNQEAHTLILGSYDFNRSFIYAQVDPAVEADAIPKVLLVSPEFENAVSRPLSEWRASEESPEASPEASPSPSPSASNEPAASPAAPSQP